MDVIMDHDEAKAIVDGWGWRGFVDYWEDQFDKKFYSCSEHWYNNSKYICKLKGAYGDLIIGWEGVHD